MTPSRIDQRPTTKAARKRERRAARRAGFDDLNAYRQWIVDRTDEGRRRRRDRRRSDS